MSFFLNSNGKVYKEGTCVLAADNRSFRYGDGLFETMKIVKGHIVRSTLHFERLFNSLAILRFHLPSYFTPAFIKEEIAALARLNNNHEHGRIRLTIYRGNGNLYQQEDRLPGYVIQTWPLEPTAGEWNTNGLITDIYPDARKGCDKFSHIKANNFLCYAMAALYAEENKLNDVLLLNTAGRICDSTIANVFIVSDNRIYTNPLSEGCIAGTFRKFLLRELPGMGIPVIEQPLTVSDVENADEIFLTNTIQQIRWVKEHAGKEYGCEVSSKIYSLVQPTI